MSQEERDELRAKQLLAQEKAREAVSLLESDLLIFVTQLQGVLQKVQTVLDDPDATANQIQIAADACRTMPEGNRARVKLESLIHARQLRAKLGG